MFTILPFSHYVFRTGTKIHDDYFPRQNALVFVVEAQCVICVVETERSSTTYPNFRLLQMLNDVLKSKSYEYLLQYSVCTNCFQMYYLTTLS